LGFDHEQAREDADPNAVGSHGLKCGEVRYFFNEKGELVAVKRAFPDFRRGPIVINEIRYIGMEPIFVGPWDQDSIMNYCKVFPNHDVTLSRMDAYAARAFYGNTAQYSNDTRIAQFPVVIAGGRRYVASLEPAGGNRWRVTGLRRTRENSVLPARYANGTLTVPFVAVYQEQDVAGRTQNNLVAFYSANLRRGRDGLFTLISYRLLPGQ